MSKDSNKFHNIKLTEDTFSKVDNFKAIVAPGKVRPTLNKNDHIDLVHTKYNHANQLNDHITLFRVQDKKGLPPKEIKNHTVPGPTWTPPSFVGFVMGALSKGYRIWSATELKDDSEGLLGKNDEVSILARESMSALMFGWIFREPQAHEKFGNTNRQPHVVLTPPTSPREFLSLKEGLTNILDVNAQWNHLPMSLDKLTKLSTPISKQLSDFLKETRLPREDFHNSLLTMLMKNELSLTELTDAPVNSVRALLLNQEVVLLLSDRKLQFGKLLAIYDEYIDNGDSAIGIEDCIDKYEDAQREVANMPEDSPYSGTYDAYDLLKPRVYEDGCPDEVLRRDSASDDGCETVYSEDYRNESNDEDSTESLNYDFEDISLSGKSSVSDDY